MGDNTTFFNDLEAFLNKRKPKKDLSSILDKLRDNDVGDLELLKRVLGLKNLLDKLDLSPGVIALLVEFVEEQDQGAAQGAVKRMKVSHGHENQQESVESILNDAEGIQISVPNALKDSQCIEVEVFENTTFSRLVEINNNREGSKKKTATVILYKRTCIPAFFKGVQHVFADTVGWGVVLGCPGSGKSLTMWYTLLRTVADRKAYGCWVSLVKGMEYTTVVDVVVDKQTGAATSLVLKLFDTLKQPERVRSLIESSCLTIYDGVTQDNNDRAWNLSVPTILVSSGGCKISNEGLERFVWTYPSWTLDEHLSACSEQMFWQSVCSTQTLEDWEKITVMETVVKENGEMEQLSDDEIKKAKVAAVVKQRAYYYEGSARWMYSPDDVLTPLNDIYLSRVGESDIGSVLSGQGIQFNHLRAFRLHGFLDMKGKPGSVKSLQELDGLKTSEDYRRTKHSISLLSDYVFDQLNDTFQSKFTKRAMDLWKVELKNNRSFNGWILELRFEAYLKHSLQEHKGDKQFTINFEKDVKWSISQIVHFTIEQEVTDQLKSDLKAQALAVMRPHNFPALDMFLLVEIPSEESSYGIQLGNITCAQRHDVKFQHVRNLVIYLQAKLGIEIKWVDFAFILPNTQKGFELGKLTGLFRQDADDALQTSTGIEWKVQSNENNFVDVLHYNFSQG